MYESNIINEYIDDRFPHPHLMPTDPAMRARLSLYGFEQDLFYHIEAVERGAPKIVEKARAAIRDNLTVIAPILGRQQYLLGDEYSVVMQGVESAAQKMHFLDDKGIKIAIDDFDRLFQPFILRQFAVDRLKIDQSFIRDVPGQADAEAIIRAIVAMGSSLGLRLIAEGVETEAKVKFLH